MNQGTICAKREGWEDTFSSEINRYFDSLSEYKTASEIDLFFFPVAKHEHFYVICINVQRKRIDILDNSAAGFEDNPLDKYNKEPEILVSNVY